MKIILTSRPLSINPISWVNLIARAKTKYPVDHIAVEHDGTVYESASPDGVQFMPYKEWTIGRENTTIITFEVPADYIDLSVFDRFFEKKTKYDYWANVLILFGMNKKLEKRANKRQYCSELVANMAGYENPHLYNPGMILMRLEQEGFNAEIRTI